MAIWENQPEEFRNSVSDSLRRFMRPSERKRKIGEIFNVSGKKIRK